MPTKKKETSAVIKKEKSLPKKVKTVKNSASKKKEQEEIIEVKPKIRIKLRSYDYKVIDNSARQIIDVALRNGAEILGPVPLPTEIYKQTVNRSTFIHKDAREQFEMRVHKRLVDVISPNQRVIDALMNLDLPAGVDIEIKM